jgi:hypothetical protein
MLLTVDLRGGVRLSATNRPTTPGSRPGLVALQIDAGRRLGSSCCEAWVGSAFCLCFHDLAWEPGPEAQSARIRHCVSTLFPASSFRPSHPARERAESLRRRRRNRPPETLRQQGPRRDQGSLESRQACHAFAAPTRSGAPPRALNLSGPATEGGQRHRHRAPAHDLCGADQ